MLENKQKKIILVNLNHRLLYMTEEILKEYYYKPEFGLLSNEKFHKKLKSVGVHVKRSDVDKFITKQIANQLTKKQTKTKPEEFNTIVAPFPGANYQMDIMIYDRYEVNNYKYVLCVIDVYSRYASCRAMTNRTMTNIVENVKSIFDEMGSPKNLNLDNEFNAKEFLEFAKQQDITLWFSQPNETNKNAIVERFNGTLARLIQKWRVATGDNVWYKALPELVKNYNETYHRTIKTTPAMIWHEKDWNHQNIVKHENKYQDGDLVRIKIPKSTFDKGDRLTYSKETYVVSNVIGNKVYLEDKDENILEKYYKPEELIIVKDIEEYKPSTSEKRDQTDVEVKVKMKEKKTKKIMKQEGLEQDDIVETNRKRYYPKHLLDEVPKPKKKVPKKKPKTFIIEKILDKKNINGKWFYKIKWKDYKQHTWEFVSDIKKDVPDLAKEFENN